MRTTIGMLRRIIREEVVRSVLRENEDKPNPFDEMRAKESSEHAEREKKFDKARQILDDSKIYGKLQTAIMRAKEEFKANGNESLSRDIGKWLNNGNLGKTLSRAFSAASNVNKEHRFESDPTYAEDWDAHSGYFLKELAAFKDFLISFEDDMGEEIAKELADLHAEAEDLYEKLDAAMPDVSHQRDSRPWSEISSEEKKRKRHIADTYHGFTKGKDREYESKGTKGRFS